MSAPCVDCGRWCPSEFWQAEIKAESNRCAKVRCLACGELRCHGEGTGRGACGGCIYGRLPGWSHRVVTCQYKGCSLPAVYTCLPGQKSECCKEHGDAVLARNKARREARAS